MREVGQGRENGRAGTTKELTVMVSGITCVVVLKRCVLCFIIFDHTIYIACLFFASVWYCSVTLIIITCSHAASTSRDGNTTHTMRHFEFSNIIAPHYLQNIGYK